MLQTARRLVRNRCPEPDSELSFPLRRSGEIGEQPSRQRERADGSDENEVRPPADDLHRQILALQEVAERGGGAAGFFLLLSRHAFHYATEGDRRTGKM